MEPLTNKHPITRINNTRDRSNDILKLLSVLWDYCPFDKISVYSIVSKHPMLRWLLYENIMMFNVYMSTMLRTAECYYYEDSAKGFYPASWKMSFDEEKGVVIMSDNGASHNAVFLTDLAIRYVGCTVDAGSIEKDMADNWDISATDIITLVSSVVKRYDVVHVSKRQRWFTIDGEYISVAIDIGTVNMDIILGETTIEKFREIDPKTYTCMYGIISSSIQTETKSKLGTTSPSKRTYDAVVDESYKNITCTADFHTRRRGVKRHRSVVIEYEDIDSSDTDSSDANSVQKKNHVSMHHADWKYSYGDYSPPEKLKVNYDIVKALDEMKIRSKPTALVLDGEKGNTTNALIKYGFYPCDIHVPNPDVDICKTLNKRGVTTSCVSLRTMCMNGVGCKLDLVFQDTCATFRGNTHYSPISDMKLMFSKRMFAYRSLYVLEVSGRSPQGSYIKTTDAVMASVLSTAAENKYDVTNHIFYSYKNTNKKGKQTGALMWVFMFWLQDTASSMTEKERYANCVLERQAGVINWRNKHKTMFVSLVPSQQNASGIRTKHATKYYGARIVFPTMKCKNRMREMRVPDISTSRYAYCTCCDSKRASGVHKHNTRTVGIIHKPVNIGDHFKHVSNFMK